MPVRGSVLAGNSGLFFFIDLKHFIIENTSQDFHAFIDVHWVVFKFEL